MNLYEAKKLICESGLKLVEEGFVSRTWGNISVKVDTNTFVITPSGRTYEQLVPEDIVQVNIHDLSWSGSIKPSSEMGLHAEAYKIRKEITAVIHTHQTNASTVSAARREIPLIDAEMEEIIGPFVKVAAYALPGSKKLKLAGGKALEKSNAALLANHGAVCVGKDMEEAFRVTRTLERVCRDFIAREFRKNTPGNGEFNLEQMHRAYLKKTCGKETP